MKRWTATLLTTLLLLIFGAADASAETRYTVQKGDTLSSIARKFHVSVNSIKEANDLDSSKLRAGSRLIIPGKGTKSSARKSKGKAKSEDGVAKRTAPEGTLPGDETGYHVVRKGETPASIARIYGLSVKELKAMNYLSAKKLKAGQRLIVKREFPDTYTVKDGDTIVTVAKKFNVLPDDIIELNSLDEKEQLKTGLVLKLRESEEEEAVENKQEKTTVSAKIEEVKELSRSGDLSSLSTKDRLILFAKKMLDLPYRFGGNGILGVDCSSFVQKVYGFAGLELPRSAREQFRVGEKIGKDELETGDLIFFKTYASFPSHVGIYLGNNLFIHASSRSKRVQVERIDAPYYMKRFIGAKRLLPLEKDPVVALEKVTIETPALKMGD